MAGQAFTKEEATAILEGPLGAELRDLPARFIAPIHWTALDDAGSAETITGTMFFVDAGVGPFAVTAAHVYKSYLKDKRRYMPGSARLGNFGGVSRSTWRSA